MHINLMYLGQRLTIGDQAFVVQRQGFFHILEGLRSGMTGGKTARHIGDDHSISGVGILVQHDREFHLVDLFVQGRPHFRPACFKMLWIVPLGRSASG